ncbi:MAG: T9SS type A sorting domain-containing protein [Bacteroidota bacterium]
MANYNSDRISRIDMSVDPPVVSLFADDSLIQGPDGLALHPGGDLISSNYDNNTMQRISPNGEVSLFATLPSLNSGYIARADSGFYVAGFFGHNIFWVNFEGEVSLFSGQSAAGLVDGPLDSAMFRNPNGIALSPTGDSLLITESHNGGIIRMITGLRPVEEDTIPTSLANILDPASVTISPNPAGEKVEISFDIPATQTVQIQLSNIQGKLVDTLVPEKPMQGQVRIPYDIPDALPAGVYFLHLQIGHQGITRRVILQ